MDRLTPPIRRSTRAARTPLACENCRNKKIKCNGLDPCFACKRRGILCEYSSAHYSKASDHFVGVLMPGLPSAGIGAPSSRQISQLSQDSSKSTTPFISLYRPLSPPSPILGSNTTLQGLDATLDVSFLSSELWPGIADVDSDQQPANLEFRGNNSFVNIVKSLQTHTQLAFVAASTQETLISWLSSPPSSSISQEGSASQPPSPPDNIEDYFPGAAKSYLAAYFDGPQYIHPILHKDTFLPRCEQLLDSGPGPFSLAFRALSLSVLSLSALVMPVEHSELIDSHSRDCRYGWSRRLFQKSRHLLNFLDPPSDIETIQCLFFQAKILQHEQDLHGAYHIIGLAVRAALSMGLNRRPHHTIRKDTPSACQEQIRTWWAIYALEVEISLLLGRPDSLGDERYHTCPLPQAEGNDGTDHVYDLADASEVGILGAMAQLYGIVRRRAPELVEVQNKADLVPILNEIDCDLDNWLLNVPGDIRPAGSMAPDLIKIARQAPYTRKQKLYLTTNYRTVRMLLVASSIKLSADLEIQFQDPAAVWTICVESAVQTIHIIYEACCHHHFFRFCWSNATYVATAVSLLLVASKRLPQIPGDLKNGMQKALDILQVLGNNPITQKTTHLLQEFYDGREMTSQADDPGGIRESSPSGGTVLVECMNIRPQAFLHDSQWDFSYDVDCEPPMSHESVTGEGSS